MKQLLLCCLLPISLLAAQSENLFTKSYDAPDLLQDEAEGKTAQEFLEENGIVFGEGASAVYNEGTHKLIVRNVASQIGLIDGFVWTILEKRNTQVYVTVREVLLDEEFSKTWDGTLHLSYGPIDLGEEVKNLVKIPAESPLKIVSAMKDPEFQAFIRALKDEPANEVNSFPSVLSRSGQLASVESDLGGFDIQTTVSEDRSVLEVNLSLFEGKSGNSETSTPLSVSIYDGDTVILSQREMDSKGRLLFVRAQVLDPVEEEE